MAVMITCEDCGRRLRVKDRSLGKTVRCPDCRKEVVVSQNEDSRPSAAQKEESAVRQDTKIQDQDSDERARMRRVTRKYAKPPLQRSPAQKPAVREAAPTGPVTQAAPVTPRANNSVAGYASRRRAGPNPIVLAVAALCLLAGIGGVVYLVAMYEPTVPRQVAREEGNNQPVTGTKPQPAESPVSKRGHKVLLSTRGSDDNPDDIDPEDTDDTATPPFEPGSSDVESPPESSGSPPFVPPNEPPIATPPDVVEGNDVSGRGPDARPDDSPAPADPPAPNDPPAANPPRPPANGNPPPPGPVDLLCDCCRGMGVVPLEKLRPYVVVEGDGMPKPEAAVRAAYCPKCQAEQDPQTLVDLEDARLKIAGEAHLDWERKSKFKFVRVETHHVTVHAQLPPQEARKVGLALEVMTAHLQKLLGTMELARTTPATYEMIILWTKPSYLQFVKMWEREFPNDLGKSWHLVPQVQGSTRGNISFFYESPESKRPPAHMAVHMAGGKQMDLATSNRRRDWLREGFCAYCENVVMRKNLVHSVSYQLNDIKLGPDWASEARRFAAAGQLRPWDDLFRLELRDYANVDHLTAYAIVYFLIQSDPAKFRQFVALVGDGQSDEEALQAAYGQTVPELQAACLRWLVGRR